MIGPKGRYADIQKQQSKQFQSSASGTFPILKKSNSIISSTPITTGSSSSTNNNTPKSNGINMINTKK